MTEKTDDLEARFIQIEKAIELLTSAVENLTATVASHGRIFATLTQEPPSTDTKSSYN